MILKIKFDMIEILLKQSLIGNKQKRSDWRLKRKRPNKLKELNKKEEKLKQKKFE